MVSPELYVFMQHSPIHNDGEDHPVVGKQPSCRCLTFPALIDLLVFLCQGQDEFCLDGNTQDTRSKRTLNCDQGFNSAPKSGDVIPQPV